MNDVDTIDGVVKRATRRNHSAQVKAEVLEACCQPDASAAAIARLYNLNANVVHRWRAEQRNAVAQPSPAAPALPQPDFIPIGVQPEIEPPPRDIRIELQRGGATAVVHWPAQAASSCAAWLREWLR
jgi:transposase